MVTASAYPAALLATALVTVIPSVTEPDSAIRSVTATPSGLLSAMFWAISSA
jgi:hypothetical protein